MSIKGKIKPFDSVSFLEKNLKWMYRTFAAAAILAWGSLIYQQYDSGKTTDELKKLYEIKNPSQEQCTKMDYLEEKIKVYDKSGNEALSYVVGLSGLTLIFGYGHRKKMENDKEESES